MYGLTGILAAGDTWGGIPPWFMILQLGVVASGAVVAIIAALIAARSSAKNTVERSLERFHSEQCWQAKRDAYCSLLRGMKEFLMIFFDFERLAQKIAADPGGPDTCELLANLKGKTSEVGDQLLADLAANALFVSDGAGAILTKCMEDVKAVDFPEGDGIEETLAMAAAECEKRQWMIAEAMAELTVFGRRDLNITWPEH